MPGRSFNSGWGVRNMECIHRSPDVPLRANHTFHTSMAVAYMTDTYAAVVDASTPTAMELKRYTFNLQVHEVYRFFWTHLPLQTIFVASRGLLYAHNKRGAIMRVDFGAQTCKVLSAYINADRMAFGMWMDHEDVFAAMFNLSKKCV